MSAPQKRVFVSYAAQDGELAKRLKARLEKATGDALGFFVSGDGDSISPGENWPDKMSGALSAADSVVVLVSQNSERSPWVFYEIGYASALHTPIIPVILPGYPLDRNLPPLEQLQRVFLNSVSSLSTLVKRLGVAPAPLFTSEDLDDILGEDASQTRALHSLEAVKLDTRDEIYWEIVRLLRSSGGKNSRIRATSALLDRDTTGDEAFDDYIRSVAEKIGDAKRSKGVADYTLVMSFNLTKEYMPPPERQNSIRNRQAAFKDANALDRMKIFWQPQRSQIEVFILGEDDLVLGFPLHPGSSRLHHGVRISGREFVIHVVSWFEACLKDHSAPVDPDTLSIDRRMLDILGITK